MIFIICLIDTWSVYGVYVQSYDWMITNNWEEIHTGCKLQREKQNRYEVQGEMKKSKI